MILGAGRGTRLRPLTNDIPKILAPVLGLPMLDRLRAWLGADGAVGAGPLAMNTHHLAAAVRRHLEQADSRGLPPLELFHEPDLLGTGGALRNIEGFWGDDPLLVWNGDIVSAVAPSALCRAMERAMERVGDPRPAAVLLLQERPTTSWLMVDERGWITGLDSPRRGEVRRAGSPRGEQVNRAFNGVSLLAPVMRRYMPADGAFDLIEVFLRAADAGECLLALDAGRAFFGTTGSLEELARLEQGLAADAALLAAWTPPD